MADSGEAVTLPARTVLVAAGTQPNTVLAREEPDKVSVDGRYFQALDEDGHPVSPERLAKPETPQVLVAKEPDGRAVSFWGDLHPSFYGNVVKAMGGAKQGYPVVSRVLSKRPPTAVAGAALIEAVNHDWRAVVHRVERLTPTIVEVVVRAPAAAGPSGRASSTGCRISRPCRCRSRRRARARPWRWKGWR